MSDDSESNVPTEPSRPHRNPALLLSDLRRGGIILAPRLEHYREDSQAIVLALVRGGVPAAVEVAKHLRLPLDVVLVRKLLVPQGPVSPVCTVNVAGYAVLDERLSGLQAQAEPGLRFFLADALQSFSKRVQVCRGDSASRSLAGKTILLVDNGARTGGTIEAAVKAIRKQQPGKIVVAIPVGSSECRSLLEELVDELICLAWHDSFGHVGMWYAKYDVPSVEEIPRFLSEANNLENV